jgi:hypothetical protein
MNMNRGIQILLVLLVAGCCAAAYWLYKSAFDVVLEPKDVIFIKVKEEPGVRPTKLQIDSATSSSAMSVYKIATRTEGSAIVVLVHAGMARRGTSGTIKYELSVPDSVYEVRFGRSSTVIWKRGASSAHATD